MANYSGEKCMEAYNKCFRWLLGKRKEQLKPFVKKFKTELEILESQPFLKQEIRDMYTWRMK